MRHATYILSMLRLLLASLLVTGGLTSAAPVGEFEAGGRIGVVFPASGLENSHDAAALFGVNLGYQFGLNRFTIDYGYTGLQAKQASPYRFDVHDFSVRYGREFVLGGAASGPTSNWGFEASAAAGVALLARTLGSARESGKAPSGLLGVGFFQRQGHSRLSLGLDNIVFIESRPAGTARTVSLTDLIALRGGVTYVF
jgi:hypothetical protein